MNRRRPGAAVLTLATMVTIAFPVSAHIGSPDVFVDGHAGAYRLLVTVRPPHAIPGVAQVELGDGDYLSA